MPWERNRIWIWDASHFTRARRVAYAIVDVVTRHWIGYLLTVEMTSTQVQVLFHAALEDQGLLDRATCSAPTGSRWIVTTTGRSWSRGRTTVRR